MLYYILECNTTHKKVRYRALGLLLSHFLVSSFLWFGRKNVRIRRRLGFIKMQLPYADFGKLRHRPLFRGIGITIEPVTVDKGQIARQAFIDFGKGRHKAGLNFGDCFAYALAKAKREPLLFKGNDFGLTDIAPAI
jgi:hypothetical protein